MWARSVINGVAQIETYENAMKIRLPLRTALAVAILSRQIAHWSSYFLITLYKIDAISEDEAMKLRVRTRGRAGNSRIGSR